MSFTYDIFSTGTSFSNKESVANRSVLKTLNTVRLMSGSKLLFEGLNKNPLTIAYEPEWEALGEFMPVEDLFKVVNGGTNNAEMGLFSKKWLKNNNYMSFDIECRVFSDYIKAYSEIKKELANPNNKADISSYINVYKFMTNLLGQCTKDISFDIGYQIDQIVQGYTKQLTAVKDAVVGAAPEIFQAMGEVIKSPVDLFSPPPKGSPDHLDKAFELGLKGIQDFYRTYWGALLKNFEGKSVTLLYYPKGYGQQGAMKFTGMLIKNVSFEFSQDFTLLNLDAPKERQSQSEYRAAPRFVDFKITLETSSHVNSNFVQAAFTNMSTVSRVSIDKALISKAVGESYSTEELKFNDVNNETTIQTNETFAEGWEDKFTKITEGEIDKLFSDATAKSKAKGQK